MNKTEATLIKLAVRDRIKGFGMPADLKKGTNSDIAQWVGDLIDKVIAEKKLVKG